MFIQRVVNEMCENSKYIDQMSNEDPVFVENKFYRLL